MHLFPPQIIRRHFYTTHKNNPETPHRIQVFQSTEKILRTFSARGNGEEYTVNKGIFYRDFKTMQGGLRSGITSTEIRYGAIQTAALRLYSGAPPGRPAAEAEGIRLQHRPVNVRAYHTGDPGSAGAGGLRFRETLIIICVSLRFS